MSQVLLAPLWRSDPLANGPRRRVANVLLVAALQFSNPVAAFVGVEGDDFSFGHRQRTQVKLLHCGKNSAAGLHVAVGHARRVESPAGISLAVEQDQAAGRMRAAGQDMYCLACSRHGRIGFRRP